MGKMKRFRPGMSASIGRFFLPELACDWRKRSNHVEPVGYLEGDLISRASETLPHDTSKKLVTKVLKFPKMLLSPAFSAT